MDFISKDVWGKWTFHGASASKAFKSKSISKKEKALFYEVALIRSDAAYFYFLFYKDELTIEEREKIFNSILGERHNALAFMKKGFYTEEERLKFQRKMEKILKPFFKYLKQFPDLLRDEEKDKFYQKHRKNLLTNIFRSDFNGLYSVFESQLTVNEIESIVDQMLKLKGKRGKFLNQLMKHIDQNNIVIPEEKYDNLISHMTMDWLTGGE